MNRFRCAVLSVVKHAYIPRAVAAHPQFELAVVADDPNRPDWTHERNQQLADEFRIPYIRDVEKAIADYGVQVAVVSSEAERHADLSVRAANGGLHVIQDKPMSNRLPECDRVVEAVEHNRVKFLMWNRNFVPALLHARDVITSGAIGELYALHVDFYFAKDAGPPKGSRRPDAPTLDWLTYQLAAHGDGSDGALGREPMGELQNEGIYPLAYIHMLTGAAVRRVFARTTAHFHQVNVDNGVEDLATVTLEMERGILGTLCIGRIGAASHPDLGEIKIHVLGSAGGLVVNEARPEVAVYYRGQPEKEFRHRRIAGNSDHLLMENFAQAIATNGETILGVRAGRAICAVVHAALESGRAGRPVEVR
jgi:myo-inositol 2-dehydrogenase / D-chiro-inositol 1-dehydrogenase